MAKKKKGLAAFVSKPKKSAPVSAKENPPPLTDIAEFVVPGFAGYAGTRFTSRAIHQVVLKRWPKLAKHASVLSTFGAATLAWLLVHRVKKISKYHTPVVVGAGIAALQTAVQAYVPKYGWLVSDHDLNAAPPAPALEAPKADAATATAGLPRALFSNWQTSKPKTTKSASADADGPAPSSDELDDLDDLDLGSLSSQNNDELTDDDLDDLLN